MQKTVVDYIEWLICFFDSIRNLSGATTMKRVLLFLSTNKQITNHRVFEHLQIQRHDLISF